MKISESAFRHLKQLRAEKKTNHWIAPDGRYGDYTIYSFSATHSYFSRGPLLDSRRICGSIHTRRPLTMAEPDMMATSQRFVHTVEGDCAPIEILECRNLWIAGTEGVWNRHACKVIHWDCMSMSGHLLRH